MKCLLIFNHLAQKIPVTWNALRNWFFQSPQKKYIMTLIFPSTFLHTWWFELAGALVGYFRQ